MGLEILARDGRARAGRLRTGHGEIETPAFMSVGTLGAVKGLGPWQLEEAGAAVMLCNLYHLALRPGIEKIATLGGLHAFTGWQRPILTDSGGFQVFSLGHLGTVDDDGVTFRSHLDGAPLRFTPEGVVAMQEALGVDVAMVLDQCPPGGAPRAAVETASRRTLAWAERARRAWRGDRGALFAIVQGGVHRDLRGAAARALAGLDFDGYAIGGVSVGEPLADRRAQVEWTAPLLPDDRPRYLMGVGTPADIRHAVGCGVDLFDCVLPTRNGRHGLLYTRRGTVRIHNARHRDDPRPLDAECGCPVCRRLSRAFLHHLFRAGEIGAPALGALHNLRFFLDFMRDLREAIRSGRLAESAAFDFSDPEPGTASDPGVEACAGGDRPANLGES